MTRTRRAGRAFAVGLAWAVAWAPVAVAIGIGVIDPDNSMDEMWAAVGAYPGFISGVLFAVFAGRRSLAELSRARAAGLGVLAGLPISLIPFAIGEPTSAVPRWQLAGGFMAAVVGLSAASALVTMFAGRALGRRRLERA